MSEQNGREIISAGERAEVVLPLVFRGGFDYRVPDGISLQPGDWVLVPFGNKTLWGVVWGAGAHAIDEKKIKDITRVCGHLPPMSDAMRGFLQWVSWYTLAPLGMVLKMTLSAPEALEPPHEETRYVTADAASIKLTPARQRIIAYLSDAIPRTAKEITLHARVSSAVLREFIKVGGLVPAHNATPARLASDHAPSFVVHLPSLSPDQTAAAVTLRDKLAAGFSVTVLDGVTGSGKTEVYFDTIAAAMESGKQVLVLLPEIALSVQWLARFEKRFGFAPDLWHSGVSPAKRRDTWRALASGDCRVVVGARSALFLPFLHLGLVVVDEEHDASYKQEDGVIYHARDMAVARASQEKIPAVLVSATPSLETEHNIERGRYARVHLPARHGGAEMPHIQLIDMRKEKLGPGQWLSETLRQALLSTYASGHQAMLFMNRRGYAPLMLCRSCGHRFQCPHCTAWLVLHRTRGRLVCHHCGHNAPVPKVCPECKHEDTLIAFGPGVERVAEEARLLFPEARIGMITSDSALILQNGVETEVTPQMLIEEMAEGKINILVGTQMIAKGHHFAGLELVGVIDADMGLGGGDLRASERTYQLLHQLSGRSGREETLGKVWLQTYLPDHPVMQALVAGERDSFMALEARMREDGMMPPYGKLAAVIVEGTNEQQTAAFARELVRQGSGIRGQGSGGRDRGIKNADNEHSPISTTPYPLSPEPLILGPAPAPIAFLRNKYRYRILIKTDRQFPLQPFLSDWLLAQKVPSALRIKIDIDPYSFI